MSMSGVDERGDETRGHPSLVPLGWQEMHLRRAQTSLRQMVNRYSQKLRLLRRSPHTVELQSELKTDLDQITNALDKLDQNILRIAVFGLVSRGKSAVINALLGQKLLQTGPLHGVTQYPRSVYWSPEVSGSLINIELIDTPGLDEVGGQLRAAMAQEVAHQADLILFVISGDITRTEYRALTELQQEHKPIILVFNKIDLYPQVDRQTICEKLQTLFAQSGDSDRFYPRFKPEDIVLVAAEPPPIQVRVEYPDGRVTHEWESPPPQIKDLKQKISGILQQEGKSLLSLNALRQARDTEQAIAHKTLKLQKSEAEDLIWKFAQWKSIAIAANPIAILDLAGGMITDLAMIRALAKLYGLPMTSHEAGKLLTAILWSSGGLLLGEVGSGLLLGVGKSAAAVTSLFDSPTGIMAYSTAAIAQAGLSGYGSYRVGKAAQAYLERGCTWGGEGANTVIQEILSTVDPNTVIDRLRRELV